MEIQIAQSEQEILACFDVMRELRTDLARDTFVERIRNLNTSGYHLAYAMIEVAPATETARAEPVKKVVAVAGFRLGQSLAWKRFLYVDDLITLGVERSKGYGRELMQWLKNYAAENNCDQLHLDSGVQRKDAHRFYEREGMQATSYHFAALVK